VRLLVCGGRNYRDAARVATELRRYIALPTNGKSIVITGGATGADELAKLWCYGNGVCVAEVPALWVWYGNVAGPVRNAAMLLLEPNVVLAFPGGKGTADMVRQARDAGVNVIVLE
jgi:predicted Rossmann-fold nucleotide-binding protein